MVISLVLGVLPAPFRHRSDSAQQPHPEQQTWSRIPGQLPVAPTDSEIYTSSAFERAWTGGAVAKQAGGPGLCKLAWSQRANAAEWAAWVANATHPRGQSVLRPPPNIARHLSRFRVRRRSGLIEPLTGMARHPLAFESVCKSSLPLSRAETAELQSLGGGLVHPPGLFNIDYILLENQCDKADKADKPKRGRNKFFDLGCTTYGDWDGDPSRPLEASGSGPSIPLFFSWYRENCVEFDDIYAWEGAHHRPAAWWRHVPPFLRPRIRFYNHYIEEADLNTSQFGPASAAPDTSFLKVLPHAATKEDFVSVKLDIDGGPELEIAYGIASRPELAELVDELFFEYHFQFDGNNFGWGDAVSHAAVDEAIKLVHHLRSLGIRSHFWI